eukprot:TRINITY_DN12546_c0_g1_i11.p2 TRINITY_DN12546_c0_g1~~TRINITY_DN12546_c0_g1_i11.p2  ORF type:complete len:218 (+),score=33.11 TRINITY_DN12546_c0_g1_i11:1653-2306(+)
MERITRAIDTIVRQVLSDAISQEELDAVIACSEEILLDAEELDDIDASSDEELLQDVIATACSGFNVNDHAQERLVLELEAAAVLDDIRNLHSKQTISIKVNDVCPVYLAEVGFQPARVEAIDTVDGELIATMQLLDFNMSVVSVCSGLHSNVAVIVWLCCADNKVNIESMKAKRLFCLEALESPILHFHPRSTLKTMTSKALVSCVSDKSHLRGTT